MSSPILGYQEHYHCNSLSDAYRLINEAGPFTTLNLRTVCVYFIFSSCLLPHVYVEGRELVIETSLPFGIWLKRKKRNTRRKHYSLSTSFWANRPCWQILQILRSRNSYPVLHRTQTAALGGTGGHKTATVQRLKKHMQEPKYHSLWYRGTPTNTTNNYILLATTLKNK